MKGRRTCEGHYCDYVDFTPQPFPRVLEIRTYCLEDITDNIRLQSIIHSGAATGWLPGPYEQHFLPWLYGE